MRARRTRRIPRAAQMLVGTLVLALPASALAAESVASHATAQPARAVVTFHHRARTRLVVHRRQRHVLAGRIATIPGRLVHAHAHVRVVLQRRVRHHWVTIGHTRVHRHGRFKLRYRVRPNTTMRMRVRFLGNRSLHPATARAGSTVGLSPAVASWYYDGGGTACGFHAGYGVANKTLPCGTKVTFVYGGHMVTATVDDRGPFVPGRTYDLNQNTARALGMYGVATVEASH